LQIKATNRKPAGLLTPLEITISRGERINIDFVTELPVTKAGNNTIVMIIDGLTKHVQWFATREADPTAKKFVMLFINNSVRTHGIPTSIVSDRDVRFQSAF
jgi:hypothetical protein